VPTRGFEGFFSSALLTSATLAKAAPQDWKRSERF
jgi:hypothetical protein